MEEKAKPIFTEEIRELTISDPGHPDTFNPLFGQVHENTKYLKQVMEEEKGSTGEVLQEINQKVTEQGEQITDLSGPYVIPEGTDIPVKDRVKGKMYFKVTSRQSGGGVNESIKVSPTMGIKIQE